VGDEAGQTILEQINIGMAPPAQPFVKNWLSKKYEFGLFNMNSVKNVKNAREAGVVKEIKTTD